MEARKAFSKLSQEEKEKLFKLEKHLLSLYQSKNSTSTGQDSLTSLIADLHLKIDKILKKQSTPGVELSITVPKYIEYVVTDT